MEEQERSAADRVRSYLEVAYGPLQSFELIPSPHEHQTHYAVAIFETSDHQQLVAKWHGLDVRKLKREMNVSELLLAHDIPTTVPIAFDETVPILIMERLKGRAMEASDITPASVGEIGSLLHRIHHIPADEVVGTGLSAWETDDFSVNMQAKFDERYRGAQAAITSRYPRELLQGVLDELLNQTTWHGKQALIRLDIHPGNWFLNDSGDIAAIDHGSVSTGDISYDLAQAIHQVAPTDELHAALRDGYGTDTFDAATQPATLAIADLLHGIGMFGWIHKRGVPQPRFQSEAIDLIDQAITVAKLL